MKYLCALALAAMAARGQESAFADVESKGKRANLAEALEIRDVRESAARDAGEALGRVDGLWKIRKGGIANDVVLRGFQSGNINVLVDGFRIYGACPNHMDPAAFHVDFSEVREVEIAKGAFDIRNSGSLGGLVNIVSKAPGQGFRFTPGLAAGSFGFVNPSAAASYLNDRVYVVAGESWRRSLAYRDGAGRRFTGYANYADGLGNAEAFNVTTAWARAGLAPRADHRLEMSYTRQMGGRTLYPYLLMDALYDNADRAAVSYRLAKRFRAETYFTRVKHWMTDELRTSAAGAPRPYGMATFASTRTFGGRLEAQAGGVTAGVESYYRAWDAVNTMRMMGAYTDQHAIPDVGTRLAGAYVQYARLFLERLQVTAGARLDTARTAANAADTNTDLFWAYKATRATSAGDTHPSANVQAGWRLPHGLELFGGAGRAARVPDPQERFFMLKRSGSDWTGSPGLRAPRNTEADLGLAFRRRRVYLRPTLFYSRIADFIALHNQPRLNAAPGVMNAAARSYANVDARIYGGELALNLGLAPQLLLSGGLSLSRGTKTPDPARRIFDRNLAEMPPAKARAGLRYGTRVFFAEVEAVFAAAQRRVDRDLREDPTPGYGTGGARAGIHTKRVNLTAGVENVLNRYYIEHLSYQRDPFRLGVRVPEPGRNLYLNASFAF